MKKAVSLTKLQAKLQTFIRKHDKQTLLASSLIFVSGVMISSFGFIKLGNAFGTWYSIGMPLNEQFNIMVSDALLGLVLFLPSLPVFLIGYLLLESHSLGIKLSMIIAWVLAALSILNKLNWEIGLTAGLMCASAATMQIIRQRKTKTKSDSPVTTENIAKFGLKLSGIIGIIILLGLVGYISARGTKYISWDFVMGANWDFGTASRVIAGSTTETMGGISHFIIGSLLLVGLCEAIALPLGLGSAVFLAEYAPQNRITSTIRLFVETLAGVPSIVLAFLGLGLFVSTYGFSMGESWLAGSLSLAFMILPWNIRVAEEAMRAVPESYREAAYALGATKWQTIRKIVLLAASPSIITGILLGVGAAIGETAVVMWTAGSTGVSKLPQNLALTGGGGMPTMAVWIWSAWKNFFFSAGISQWEAENLALSGAFILLVMFLAISILALVARNHFSKKLSGR
jgi:phosphate transport system permease protein